MSRTGAETISHQRGQPIKFRVKHLVSDMDRKWIRILVPWCCPHHFQVFCIVFFVFNLGLWVYVPSRNQTWQSTIFQDTFSIFSHPFLLRPPLVRHRHVCILALREILKQQRHALEKIRIKLHLSTDPMGRPNKWVVSWSHSGSNI